MSASAAETLEEIGDKVTGLYHMQRVNFEAADELTEQACPFWKTIGKHRLSEVASIPDSSKTSHLYHKQWMNNGAIFHRTSLLFGFLEEGCWPNFALDDEEKRPLIETWMELIGLSADAKPIHERLQATRNEIYSLLRHGDIFVRDNAQDIRGWYVHASTSRRDTHGWVVGGRGNTLAVLPDPLAGIGRMLGSMDYSPRLTDKRVASQLASKYGTFDSAEVQKYSLKTAGVQLIFPPDLADERKEWSRSTSAKVATSRTKANPIWQEFCKWEVEARPLIARAELATGWMKSVPTKPAEGYAQKDGPLRWQRGAAEAIEVMFKALGWTEDDLRSAMVDEYRRRNPLSVLTEAEQALVDAKPMGSEDLPTCVAEVLVADHTGLAPTF